MKSPNSLFLSCLLALAIASACNGGTTFEGTPSEGQNSMRGIINGIDATESRFDPVVQLTVGGMGICSGTVISDHYVLTAAHCIYTRNCTYNALWGTTENCQLEDRPERYGIRVFERGELRNSQVRGVSEVLVHEAYDNFALTNDIALLKLEKPFEGLTPIPALPNVPGLMWTKEDEGLIVTFAGYGLDEDGQSGRRLKIDNPVQTVCLEDKKCDAWSIPNTVCHAKGEGLICNGDSGGPLLIERNGVTYVGGVTSYGDEGCKRFGCSTAVSSFSGWIAQHMGGNSKENGDDCVEDSQCNSGVCSLGVCCDKACTNAPCQACSVYRGRSASVHGTCGNADVPCDDNNACTLNDVCLDGTCISGAPKTCPAEDVCNAASLCDSATGTCLAKVPLPNGTVCDDHNACTLNDVCFLGACISEGQVICPDHPCRRRVGAGCLPATGQCAYENLADGTACTTSDGTPATCVSGMCSKESTYGCNAASSSGESPVWGGWLALVLSLWGIRPFLRRRQ